MCGILIDILKYKPTIPDSQWSTLSKLISSRGPDHQQEAIVECGDIMLRYFSSVLSLRGCLTKQPLENNNHLLFFNGELYNEEIALNDNDSQYLMNLLTKKESINNTYPKQSHQPITHQSTHKHHNFIINSISSLRGEFALVYFNSHSKTLYFTRDPLGRRSLLIHAPNPYIPESSFMISSTAYKSSNHPNWQEVSTEGIHYIKLDQTELFIEMTRWPQESIKYLTSFLKLNDKIPNELEVMRDNIPASVVLQFHRILYQAVQRRVSNIPLTHPDGRLAILFSGGLDCSCLAAISHSLIPLSEPISLINVAFENPRVMKSFSKSNQNQKSFINPQSPYDACPDRQTGLRSFAELIKLYPRPWRFVQVNVPYEEYVAQKQHISDLMFPLTSVMDFSIAAAFWFAARGKGTVDNTPFNCKSRVLLSGLGADEQLGGYGRHAVRFKQFGFPGLIEELQFDINRLPSRNLGRDDRVISDHGKEVRFPYLDFDVITHLSQLPINFKTNPLQEKGKGDKKILRQVAFDLYGLNVSSNEPKRAVQFGSRTAKMEKSNEKGTNEYFIEV